MSRSRESWLDRESYGNTYTFSFCQAQVKVWSLKEASDHCEVICNRVTSYARRQKTTTVDFPDISKLARIFNMTIENLVEILEKIAKILTFENIDIIR